MSPLSRRSLLLAPLAARADVDFSCLIPRTLARTAAYREPGFHLWDPAMVRTPDGVCHLLYSRWPKELGFDAWATHAEIAWATAERPEGPYHFRRVVMPSRGHRYWDGHSVYNTCLLFAESRYYLYYTGNRGPADWDPKRPLTTRDEAWWKHRNNQRVGVAVARHPRGPWKRFDKPLIDTGPETGTGIIAVPNAIARADGGYFLYYKTLAPGEGRFGGGVVHYASTARHPLGPFTRVGSQMVDKQRLLNTQTRFNFHLDDHVEWFQKGRYWAIVKDHDAPFLTPHGRSLLLMESADGLSWKFASQSLVKDFNIHWDGGATEKFERLEMPKLHIEDGTPKALFLAAKSAEHRDAESFLLAIRLKEDCPR